MARLASIRSDDGAGARGGAAMQSWVRLSTGLVILALVLSGASLASRRVEPSAAALQDAIVQNTPGFSEGFPVGVPRTYAWCNGAYRPASSAAPPPDFSAVTGWGQVYRMYGATGEPSQQARVIVANFRTYVRLSDGAKWVLVQSQTSDAIEGGHFVADFAGNRAVEMSINRSQEGAAIGVPPRGFNSHFWPEHRGTFAPGSVSAVYVQLDAKATEAEPGLVANVGADWWRDASAEYVSDFSNNPGAGMSNWVALSTEWAPLRFYSGSVDEFLADPPPPMREAGLATLSTTKRREATTPSPCLVTNHHGTP